MTLANFFYCDEGEYDDKQVCINPQLSMAALESAASRGSVDALSQLGEVYEVGTVAPADLPRAMACYQEVQKKRILSPAREVLTTWRPKASSLITQFNVLKQGASDEYRTTRTAGQLPAYPI